MNFLQNCTDQKNPSPPGLANNHHLHVEEEEEEKEMEEVELSMPEPSDGGWGWVVVFCSFMIHVIVDGITYTFGIFYLELLRHFGESKGSTAWVASITVGTTFCVGPFASGLTNQFGCRTVTIIGSLLATFGLVISTMAPNITFLYFSIGLCTGTGFGLMYLPAIVCVTCYFERRRAFATGIAVCGSGVGTSVFAPLVEWLVRALGWQGAMLVTAGLVLNCSVFGALLRPMTKTRRVASVTMTTRRSVSSNHVVQCKGKENMRTGSLPNGTIETNGEICLTPLKLQKMCLHSASIQGIDYKHHSPSCPDILNAASMKLSCSMTSYRRSSLCFRGGSIAGKDVFYSGNILQESTVEVYTFELGKKKQKRVKASKESTKSRKDIFCSRNILQDSTVEMFTIELEDAEQKGVEKSMKSDIPDCLCPPRIRQAFKEMMNFQLMANVIFLMFGFSNFFTNIGFNVPYVYIKDRAIGLGIADETQASNLLSIIGIANTIARVFLGYLSDRSCINRLWLYNGSLALCGFATIFSSFCNSYCLMAAYAAAFGATSSAYVSLTSVLLVDLLGVEKLTNAFGLLLLFQGVACLIGPPITGWLYDYTGSYDSGFYTSGLMIAISGLMLFFIPCVQSYVKKKQEKSSINEIAVTPKYSKREIFV